MPHRTSGRSRHERRPPAAERHGRPRRGHSSAPGCDDFAMSVFLSGTRGVSRFTAMTIAGRYFSHRDGLRDYIEEGPLLPALDEFANELETAGYSPHTTGGYLRGARHL